MSLKYKFKNPVRKDSQKITTMNNLKLIFIGLIILTTETIYGQTNRFDIGIEGSPGLTFLRGNDFIDKTQKTTIGFSGGLFYQFNFKKIISPVFRFATP